MPFWARGTTQDNVAGHTVAHELPGSDAIGQPINRALTFLRNSSKGDMASDLCAE
jgi:hypothetical protein